MKKFLIFLSIAFLIGLPLFNIGTVAYAESEEELISEIEDNVNGQLEDLDLSGLESILSNLNSQQSGIFGSTSFIEKLQSILSGEFTDNAGSVWEAILKLIFDELLKPYKDLSFSPPQSVLLKYGFNFIISFIHYP